jgi:hypothetical protein
MHPWRRDKQAQEDPAFRQRFNINQHQMHSFVTISATSIWGVGNRNTVVPTPQCSVDSLSQVSQLQSHPLRTRTSLTWPSHGRCSRQSRTHHRHLTSLAQRLGSQETPPLFMKVGPYPSKKEKPKPNIHGCHHLVVEASHFNLGRVHHTGLRRPESHRSGHTYPIMFSQALPGQDQDVTCRHSKCGPTRQLTRHQVVTMAD